MTAPRFGYACLALGVPDTKIRSCTLRTVTEERLREITAHNLGALLRLVRYNAESGIPVFRISSDLIPFGSSPANTLEWRQEFAGVFEAIGGEIARTGLRVSMHPGQYTVLNSPDEDVVARAAADLEYHEQVLRLLKTGSDGKLILHVGGVYGDKTAARGRFCKSWERLSDSVRDRIVLENDEHSYSISDVLSLAGQLEIPAVFDVLHHTLNPPDGNHPPAFWIEQCAKTWKRKDGRQKIHYSQQNAGGPPGAHSRTIAINEFLRFYKTVQDMDLDIMLEVKDKNLSAVKCALTLSPGFPVRLEQEWEQYRYSVLEHSPQTYEAIGRLLQAWAEFSPRHFYTLLEQALGKPAEQNDVVNAALQVWEYLKNAAAPGEQRRFLSVLSRYQSGTVSAASIKNLLFRLAQKYDNRYLLHSYYFLQQTDIAK